MKIAHKTEIRAIEAWRHEEGWTWNNSITAGEFIISQETLNSSRMVLAFMRANGFLTEQSTGKVRIDDNASGIIEVQNKNTYEPLFAIMIDDNEVEVY
jgi:hypothetical protein